jgi:hypothetical protein
MIKHIRATQLRIAALLFGLFTISLWLVPLVAWAADAAAPVTTSRALWQTLLLPVVSVVGLFIAAFLTLGLKKLTQLAEAKWKIDVPAAVEDLMSQKALQLCAWAEEKAENNLLHKDGKPTSGAEKADQVITAMIAFANSMGYGKDWQREKIEQLVAGVLHLNREGSAGVVGSNGTRGKEIAKVEATTAANNAAATAVTPPSGTEVPK